MMASDLIHDYIFLTVGRVAFDLPATNLFTNYLPATSTTATAYLATATVTEEATITAITAVVTAMLLSLGRPLVS